MKLSHILHSEQLLLHFRRAHVEDIHQYLDLFVAPSRWKILPREYGYLESQFSFYIHQSFKASCCAVI
nr:MAG TPA: hypothetical protein [Caudoviricetes sp.]